MAYSTTKLNDSTQMSLVNLLKMDVAIFLHRIMLKQVFWPVLQKTF